MPKSSDSVTDLLRPDGSSSAPGAAGCGTLEAQLQDLYAQRQELQRALGTADSRAIIAMVRSLEAQLRDLYTLLQGQNAHLPEPPGRG
jgi:hypothetical protein